ncbi:DUF3256 family protein [Porphyromonadaceae bacterium W3.11]|nr:DUF3256 family protein [Porphyromonadaceae bacterium W3.11]
MKLYKDILGKFIVAIILMHIGVVAMMAQRPSIRQVFEDAPSEVIPALGDLERSQVFAVYEAKLKGEADIETSKNMLGAEVTLLRLTDDYLQMTLDPSTELQMKLLPYKGSKGYLISMVATSLLEPKQSVIVFYDKDWNRLETSDFIQSPDPADYFISPDDSNRREIKDALVERGRWSYQIVLDADGVGLSFRMTTFDEALARELHPDVMPLLKKEGVRYEWSKRSKSYIKK